MKTNFWRKLLCFAATLPAFAAHAAVVVNVAGIKSNDAPGAATNTVLTYNLGAYYQVTNLNWSVSLTANAPSWLSEMQVRLTGSAVSGNALVLAPGFGNDASGSGTYSGNVNLAAQGLDFAVGGDGVLRLEFNQKVSDGVVPAGTWTAGNLTLDVTPPTPPTVSVNPAGATLYSGQTAAFTALPTGAPPFAYQWRFNGTNLPGATQATLVLTNVQPSASGRYSVTATNLGGAASATATLTVLSPPPPITQIVSDAPLGYWRLNEAAGPTAHSCPCPNWRLNRSSSCGSKRCLRCSWAQAKSTTRSSPTSVPGNIRASAWTRACA